MPSWRFLFSWRILALLLIGLASVSVARAQGAKQTVPESRIPDSDADHVKERSEWFFRGRLVRGKPSAELRRRAYEAKLQMRTQHAAAIAAAAAAGHTPAHSSETGALSSGAWTPLGPVPLASDATGNGTQNYGQVSGRATAVAIDPADATGNTVYIGGAQGGVWKSTNAASSTANGVDWTPVADDQATLSIGAIAIQPGNANPSQSVILAATGEADDSGDSYFGLGIMVSTNAGNTWTLVSTANGGALSFSGLGGTRMAFNTASGQMSTVVSAMATSSEGMVDGAVTANTTRGLYTSSDAGQTWTYDALVDPGGATDATSATSVVYNATAGVFFAAIRYHGFYSSPDGVNWTRLAVQPGGAALSTTACPPQSTSNSYACPIYRAEITVVPGRNEMYAWYISLAANGSPVDEGIWQSLNGGASWTSIPDTTITNCGDIDGCGVQQGAYNLELLAVPNGEATDLYAGAVNLYKCGINSVNPTCATSPFINLTHVYGCDPIAAPSHVHPDQHALAYAIPSSGSDSGNELLYFANDGGVYRALNGFVGLSTGLCTGTNQFDDLNQDLGSMTQFVSFSQHPTDPNTLLGGTQDNGSPASSQATTNLSWGNVLGGDGGYNAIDPAIPSNWYASNPDVPPGGLGVQFCPSGVSCDDSGFSFVVTSNTVGGDDGAFYFPYMLDPQSSTAMLVGTCRVWRGARAGGAYTVLSPNFDTLGSGTCSGSEVNLVQALAAGGPTDQNGSSVIYATTSALGPLDGPLTTPTGGHVWVTTDASAGVTAFTDTTNNGPQGSSINPNQFPISGVAIDSSDLTGNTAYVTVMGFTGGAGHVWKTTDAGAAWTDFTANLPDSPVNAVVVYPGMSQVYVATDVGVFGSATSAASWTELGPSSGPNQTGFLPNVAVTALGVFDSGGQQLLRASTYGRGVWQYNLVVVPDFELSVSNSPLTISVGQAAVFSGSASAQNGYASSVTLTCTAGATAAPATCIPAPSTLTPEINTPFTVTAGGAIGDYYFNVQGAGSDTNHTTHEVSAVLHVLSNSPDFMLSEATAFPTVNAGSSASSGPMSVTATTGFTGVVSLTCSLISGSGSCSVSPSAVGSFPTTANVTVNAATMSAGSYQMLVQGTSGGTTHTLLIPFNVGDYQISGTQALTVGLGAQGTATLTITPSTYYSGNINATCNASALTGATCTLNPNPILVSLGSTASLVVTIGVPSNATPGTYSISINTEDSTGTPSHNFTISLTAAQNFVVTSSTASQTVTAGQTSGAYNLNIQPVGASFTSPVTLSCTGGLPPGAQCLFNPSTPVTPGSSSTPVAMTVSTGASSVLGTYSLTVTGTAGGFSHSVSVTLVVSGDFLLATTQPFPANVDAGTQVTAHVSVTPNYSGSVTASCNSSAMPGAQCAISPSNPIAITTNTAVPLTVTLTVPNYASPSAYSITLTVADSSGQPSHTLSLPLTVIQDFSISSATASETVSAGQTTAPYQLTIAPNPSGSSFTSAIVFSCRGLPADTQCLFSPSTPLTLGSSAADVVMSISTGAAASAGTSSVTVIGTSGSLSHSAVVSLIVTSSAVTPELNLKVTQPFASNVDAGSQSTAQVSVTPNYSGSVNATCDASAMPGAQCTVTPANPVAISANVPVPLTVSLNLPNTAVPAAYDVNLTVADSSGQPSQTVQLPLTVIADFTVSSATPSQTVTAGQTSGAYQLSIAPNPPGSSFNAAVTLACTAGLPGGAQCIFSPSTPITTVSPDVVMNISTAASSADMRLRPSGGMSAGTGVETRTSAVAILFAPWLLLPGIVIGWGVAGARPGAKGRQRGLIMVLVLLTLFLSLSLLSCGGVSNGGGGGTTGLPVTYTVTVTGTSGTLSHSTQVTLIVDGSVSGSSQEVSGAWEFAASSTVTIGSTTLIEADLSASGPQTSASGPSAVQTATYLSPLWYVNGSCSGPSLGQNSISGTVSGNGISLTFNEGGNVFTGEGSLGGTTISGTYSGTNPGCSDSGTFTGTQVPNLAGTFSGSLVFSTGSDHVIATLTEGNNYSLTFQTTLSGTDNGDFTFSGSAVGNVAFVSGTISGNPFSLFGYYDASGMYTGIPNSIAVFDYSTLEYEGTLVRQ